MKLKEAKAGLKEAQKQNSRYWINFYQKKIDEMTGKNKVVEIEPVEVKEDAAE